MIAIEVCAHLACIWETTARCPGNAHRYRDFADASYVDFLASAAAMAPILTGAADRAVGLSVLEAIRATRQVTTRNTNLGTVLLLAPLAAVPRSESLRRGVERVLDQLSVDDSRAVYEAIRLAAPAGLGEVSEQDIANEPTAPLRSIMALAAAHDLVARQYANGFHDVFEVGLPALAQGIERAGEMENAIIFGHLTLMARYPDSLIARKRGLAEAEEAARRAAAVLEAGWPGAHEGAAAILGFDGWLRADERGRNPGATSDLVTASLFAALRDGIIQVPLRIPWSGMPHD